MVIEHLQAGLRVMMRLRGLQPRSWSAGGLTVEGFAKGSTTPTVCFLHGLGDASTAYVDIVRHLGDQRMVLLDLPGHGRSQLPPDQGYLTVKDHANVLASVLKGLPRPRVLVGQSLGGWVSLRTAVDHPGVMDGLVLVNPAGVPVLGALKSTEMLSPTTPDEVLALWNQLWYDTPRSAAMVAKLSTGRFQKPHYRGFLEGLRPEDGLTPNEIASLDLPGVVLWGHHDGLLPREIGVLLHRHAPRLWATYVARAGHLVHLERPDVLLRGIRSVLAEVA